MSLFSRKASKTYDPAEGLDPDYSYCETVHATAVSPNHIRAIGAQGLKTGGGADSPALCGRDLMHGWDLYLIPLDDDIDDLANTVVDGRRLVCRECADKYLDIKAATP